MRFNLFGVIVFTIMLVGVCNGFMCHHATDSHNINQCDISRANVPLLQTNVYEPARFLGTVRRTIVYPETIPDTPSVIKCIKVINLDPSDTGGYPKILSGGVGSYDVEILLTSQWGRPINFRIEIWTDV